VIANTFSSKCRTHYRRIEELVVPVSPKPRQQIPLSRGKRKASELSGNNTVEKEDEISQYRRIRLRSIRTVENHTRKAYSPILEALDGTKGQNNNHLKTCTNCFSRVTPLWRRDPEGRPLCNLCGLYYKLHGVVRPLSRNNEDLQKRKPPQPHSSE
jgi:hypothetical protein